MKACPQAVRQVTRSRRDEIKDGMMRPPHLLDV